MNFYIAEGDNFASLGKSSSKKRPYKAVSSTRIESVIPKKTLKLASKLISNPEVLSERIADGKTQNTIILSSGNSGKN